MVKALDHETSRSYRWKLELMYLKCGKISIFILFNLYSKAILGSLQLLFLPSTIKY